MESLPGHLNGELSPVRDFRGENWAMNSLVNFAMDETFWERIRPMCKWREGVHLAFIDVFEVVRTYSTGSRSFQALHGVSFQVVRGEFVSIMGPSGSGKSTLLNVLGCLDRPDGGTYHLGGCDTAGLSQRQLADLRGGEIGFVFQTFNLIQTLDAQSNVEVPLIYRGRPAAERKDRCLAALDRVGLAGRADHLPGELSGGEQQRVALARALVTGPSLVLADEPTGNLDSETSHQVMSLLGEINDRLGVTVIQVTHDQIMAEYARRIIRLRDGKVVGDELLGGVDARSGQAAREGG